MEQITVTHRSGLSIDLFSAEYGRYVRVCRHEVENQATDVVIVEVDAAAKVEFAVGDMLTAGGQRYHLNTLPEVIKDGTRLDGLLAYRAEFESVKYDLRYITFMLPEGGQSDAYTGTLADWLRLIVRNANRVKGTYSASSGSGFLVGIDYYAPYTHTQDVFFKSGKSYYVEQDGATGREIVQLQDTAYTVGFAVGVWEQQHGSSAYYDVVRVMEESDVYIRMVPGVDYALGMAKKDGVYYTFSELWSVGVMPSFAYSKYVTKEYAGQTLLAVLQDVCVEYGAEYRITETQSGIVLSAYDPQSFPVDLSVRYGHGRGLYRIQRNMVASTDIITRLYVYGSTENLYPSYRYGRLCIPGKTKEQSYIEGELQVAQYGIKEGVVVYDDIRPERSGTVSAVYSDVLTFTDDSMDFNLNAKWANTDADFAEWLLMRGEQDTADSRTAFQAAVGSSKYMIAGTSPKVHFNSGDLAGREYEIAAYDDSTATFTIVRDADGLPDSVAGGAVSVGDEYVLLDIYMPYSYIEDAEQRLSARAQQEYAAFASPLPVYSVALTRGWVQTQHHQDADIITAGDFINVYDEDTDADDDIQIQSYTRNYLTEDEYTVTLCNIRRETYWQRYWRRERRTLSRGVSERADAGASSIAGGVGFTTSADGNDIVVSGGPLRLPNGVILNIGNAVLRPSGDGDHVLVATPIGGGRAQLRVIPSSYAGAVSGLGEQDIVFGMVSSKKEGQRMVHPVGCMSDTPAEWVSVVREGERMSLASVLGNIGQSVRPYNPSVEGEENTLYYGAYNGVASLWFWDGIEYVRIGDTAPVRVDGVEFNNYVNEIHISEGEARTWDYSAYVTPEGVTEDYTLDYSVVIESGEAQVIEDAEAWYIADIGGTYVLQIDRNTMEARVVENVSINCTIKVSVSVNVSGVERGAREQNTMITY